MSSFLFAATIKHTHLAKAVAFERLGDHCSKLVVAQENHFDQTLHHHLFMRTMQAHTLLQAGKIIRNAYDCMDDDGDGDADQTNLIDQHIQVKINYKTKRLSGQVSKCQQNREQASFPLGDQTSSSGASHSQSSMISSPNENAINNSRGNDSVKYADNTVEYSEKNTMILIGDNTYVAFIRDVRAYLKYITKFDYEPVLKNVSAEQLSFYCQSISWARHTSVFKIDDPYVLANPQYYNKLRQLHQMYSLDHFNTQPGGFCSTRDTTHSKLHTEAPIMPQPVYPRGANINESATTMKMLTSPPRRAITDYIYKLWHEKVLNWWNDWILHGYQHKKRQLYLWGPSDTGKTTFIFNMLKQSFQEKAAAAAAQQQKQISLAQNQQQREPLCVLLPMRNEARYAWQQFNANVHKCVLIDDFDMDEYNASQFKKALAGEPIILNRKHMDPIKITIQVPIILISNYPPPTYLNRLCYAGITERLHIIHTHEI